MFVLPVADSFNAGIHDPQASAWYSPMQGLFWICDRGVSSGYRGVPERVPTNNLLFDFVFTFAIVSLLTTLFTNFDRVSGRSA